ncbi:MAG: virulence RhuM family protein [Luteolibacter sp.]
MPDDLPEPSGSILLYQTEDGSNRVECRFQDETLWLSQALMAELFDTSPQNITQHLKSLYEDGEITEAATCKEYLQVRQEGSRSVRRGVKHYNLDVILAVGFRVRSPRGTQFRQWATAQLREFLTQGFLMDDERMKNPDQSVYFERVLGRIRDIRSSEKVFWRKVCDIYATSIDYDPKHEVAEKFFATIQNKMHWATHGKTAAEIIFHRADATQPHMGLTVFPAGTPRKSDVSVAKNYLNEVELGLLNRIVTAYLEFAEIQALRRRPMRMVDWISKLDDFLKLGDHELLTHAGKISAEQAKEKAETEYATYRRMIDQQPSEVDKHLADALQKLERIDKKYD